MGWDGMGCILVVLIAINILALWVRGEWGRCLMVHVVWSFVTVRIDVFIRKVASGVAVVE